MLYSCPILPLSWEQIVYQRNNVNLFYTDLLGYFILLGLGHIESAIKTRKSQLKAGRKSLFLEAMLLVAINFAS